MACTAKFPMCLLRVIIVAAMSLTVASMDANAQSAPGTMATPSADSLKEISVEPDARDTEIALRLQRILDASGWFNPIAVSVREGLVFLDGQTETDERKEWARQLALRTQDVVAVVNRVEVKPQVSWDLTPAWREVVHLSDQAQRLAPIAVVSLIILLIFWFLSRGVAAFSRRVLRHRIPSPLLLQIVARTLAIPVFLIGLYLVLQVAGLTRLAITVIGGTGLIGIVIGTTANKKSNAQLLRHPKHNGYEAFNWDDLKPNVQTAAVRAAQTNQHNTKETQYNTPHHQSSKRANKHCRRLFIVLSKFVLHHCCMYVFVDS